MRGIHSIFKHNKASVKWLNDYQIQISTIPGIVTGDEEANKKLMGYIYDIKLQRKLYAQGAKVNIPHEFQFN